MSSRRPLVLGPVARATLVAVLATALVLGLQLSATAAGEQTIVLTEEVQPGDGYPNGRYLYLPFDVPEGVRRIDVKVTHDGNPSTDKLGAGLFDQRGAGYQDGGFRGIYGEERGEFFVAADEASQSFTPGPIDEGRWTVVVPVFRTGPAPFTVTATVKLTFGDEPAAARLGAAQGVVDPAAGWYRGDLHVHTNESSDAFGSSKAFEARRYGELARRAGLDWVSLTDHNVTKQNRTLAQDHGPSGTLVLGGEEMTNWFHGHATVTGLSPGDHLDWRQRPAGVPLKEHEVRIQRFIEEVRRRNVYTAVAHPYGATLAWQFFADAGADPDGALADGLEVWTGPFQPDDELAMAQWDELLLDGRRIFANGGSDVHGFDRGDGFALAEPTTIAYADQLSKAAVVSALKRGRSFVTRRSDGVELYLTAAGPDGQRQVVGGTIYGDGADAADLSVLVRRAKGGRLVVLRDGVEVQVTPITSDEQRVAFSQPIGAGGFVRVELRRDPALSPAGQPTSSRLDMEAFTNPIFLVAGPVPPGTQPEDAPPPAKPGPRRPTGDEQAPAGGDHAHPEVAPTQARAALGSARACLARSALVAAAARPLQRGLSFEFARRGAERVDVDVFRHSSGRRVLGERLVRRFRSRTSSFRWSGGGPSGGDGSYTVRFSARSAAGLADVRRIALERRDGRFRVRGGFERREPCGALASLKAVRPVFGGRTNRALGISYRIGAGTGSVTVEVLRGRRVVRRFAPVDRRAGVTHRLQLAAKGLPPGEYRVRLSLRLGEPLVVRTIVVRRV